MYCQYCVTPQFDLVAIHSIASDTTIHICPLCVHHQKKSLSGQNGSITVVRDTPVADYSAPGTNTTSRIPYRPLIAVLLFLLTLSVSYFKRTLWLCGQVWPYVGISSLGTSAKCKLVRKPHAGFHKRKALHLSYSSLSQSQDLLPHNMPCIIYVSLYRHIL